MHMIRQLQVASAASCADLCVLNPRCRSFLWFEHTCTLQSTRLRYSVSTMYYQRQAPAAPHQRKRQMSMFMERNAKLNAKRAAGHRACVEFDRQATTEGKTEHAANLHLQQMMEAKNTTAAKQLATAKLKVKSAKQVEELSQTQKLSVVELQRWKKREKVASVVFSEATETVSVAKSALDRVNALLANAKAQLLSGMDTLDIRQAKAAIARFKKAKLTASRQMSGAVQKQRDAKAQLGKEAAGLANITKVRAEIKVKVEKANELSVAAEKRAHKAITAAKQTARLFLSAKHNAARMTRLALRAKQRLMAAKDRCHKYQLEQTKIKERKEANIIKIARAEENAANAKWAKKQASNPAHAA